MHDLSSNKEIVRNIMKQAQSDFSELNLRQVYFHSDEAFHYYRRMSFSMLIRFLNIEDTKTGFALTAYADGPRPYTEVSIWSPEPRSSLELSIFLHEIGHVYNGDSYADSEYGKLRAEAEKSDNINILQNSEVIHNSELAASRWAIDTMRELGVLTKTAIRFLNQCAESYGIAPEKLFNVDAEMEKCHVAVATI